MKSSLKFSMISVLLLCSACGAQGDLVPRAGNKLPVKAYAQTQEQSAESLLLTNVQARPSREAEILSRSTVREEDPFDLPPESITSEIPDDLDPLEPQINSDITSLQQDSSNDPSGK